MKSTLIPHIVVVGGGAGGMELVTRLGKQLGKTQKAKVTLIDKNLTHFWKPLLHEVAAGTLNASDNEVSYLNHAKRNHYYFELGDVIGLERSNKTLYVDCRVGSNQKIIIPKREIKYDFLIFAVGSLCNDFNTPGVQQYCDFLETRLQAETFHQQLLEKLFSSHYDNKAITIAIVGAGATGVELAAELQYTLSHIHHFGFKKIEKDRVHLSLIEAAPRILAALPEKVSQSTKHELENINVKIMTNERVDRITEKGLYTSDGDFIPAEMKVWAAGIKAPEFLSHLDGLQTNALNQLIVKQNLQTTIDEAIFAFGDCASVPQPNKQVSVPALAQAAHQEAKLLAKSLNNCLTGKAALNFTFRYRGSLISLSRYSTVGYLMGRLPGRLMIEGKIARFFYLMLYKIHQMTLIGVWRTFITTLSNLLTRRFRPRLKLH